MGLLTKKKFAVKKRGNPPRLLSITDPVLKCRDFELLELSWAAQFRDS